MKFENMSINSINSILRLEFYTYFYNEGLKHFLALKRNNNKDHIEEIKHVFH